MWGMWLGFVPIGVFVSSFEIPGLSAVFAPAWMTLLIMISGFVVFSKCPRCNSLFHTTMLWGNPWARKCIHCSLPLRR